MAKTLGFVAAYEKMAKRHSWPKINPVRRDDFWIELNGTKIVCDPVINRAAIPFVVIQMLLANGFDADMQNAMLVSGIMPDGKRFGKWLSRCLPEAVVQKTFRAITPPAEVEVTCRFKDVLRMAETNHFISCFNTQYNQQLLHYLMHPSVALIVKRDSKGQFNYRCIVRIGVTCDLNPRKVLMLNTYKTYGNGPHFEELAMRLEKITNLPVYQSVRPGGSFRSIRTTQQTKVPYFTYDDATMTSTDVFPIKPLGPLSKGIQS